MLYLGFSDGKNYLDFVEVTVIATLVRRIDKPSVTVGIDGALYRFHPYFHKILTKTIPELLKNKYKVSCQFNFFPAKSNRPTIVFILCYLRRKPRV